MVLLPAPTPQTLAARSTKAAGPCPASSTKLQLCHSPSPQQEGKGSRGGKGQGQRFCPWRIPTEMCSSFQRDKALPQGKGTAPKPPAPALAHGTLPWVRAPYCPCTPGPAAPAAQRSPCLLQPLPAPAITEQSLTFAAGQKMLPGNRKTKQLLPRSGGALPYQHHLLGHQQWQQAEEKHQEETNPLLIVEKLIINNKRSARAPSRQPQGAGPPPQHHSCEDRAMGAVLCATELDKGQP